MRVENNEGPVEGRGEGDKQSKYWHIKKFGAQLNYLKLFTFYTKREEQNDIMGLFNFLSHCRHPSVFTVHSIQFLPLCT